MSKSSFLENRVSALEKQVRQLSTDINRSLAKDRELLARLRSGKGTWRALRNMQQQHDDEVGHPYDEASVIVKQDKMKKKKETLMQKKNNDKELSATVKHQQKCGDSSAGTDQAVLEQRSVSDQNKDSRTGNRDASSI